MSMKKVFPPRLCEKPGCERVHSARGLCGVHYHMDLSWTGVKCRQKGCKKAGSKGTKLCESHRKHERVMARREKGLCCSEGCPEKGVLKVLYQNGKEMYRTIMKFCFEHLRNVNSRNAKIYAKKKDAQKSCGVCHSNPAKLCVSCAKERR